MAFVVRSTVVDTSELGCTVKVALKLRWIVSAVGTMIEPARLFTVTLCELNDVVYDFGV